MSNKPKNQMVINSFTPSEETMLELLKYPNPEGLHSIEDKWRNFARQLKLRLDFQKSCNEDLESRIRQLEDRREANNGIVRIIGSALGEWRY